MRRCQGHSRSLRSKNKTKRIEKSNLAKSSVDFFSADYSILTCQIKGKLLIFIMMSVIKTNFHIEQENNVLVRTSCAGCKSTEMTMVIATRVLDMMLHR